MIIDFDSKEESEFFYRNDSVLTLCSDSYFPCTFKDSNNETFRARPDFMYNGIYIEYKSHQLNTSSSRLDAITKWENQQHWIAPRHRAYNKLKIDWNHSVYKQGIVARAYPDNFLLVFKEGTKLSTQSKNRMKEQEITWCYEPEMMEHLSSKTLH